MQNGNNAITRNKKQHTQNASDTENAKHEFAKRGTRIEIPKTLKGNLFDKYSEIESN